MSGGREWRGKGGVIRGEKNGRRKYCRIIIKRRRIV